MAGDKDDGPRDGNFPLPFRPDLTVTNDEKRLVVDSYHCFLPSVCYWLADLSVVVVDYPAIGGVEHRDVFRQRLVA